MKTRILASLAIVSLAASASAQDTTQEATYGTISLEAGFVPDPNETSLMAGGSVTVTEVGCAGNVAAAPNLELTFTGGENPLHFYVTSDSDTTLVVNGPDGEWYCSDDENGYNPAVAFEPGLSGVYDIWVGTYDSGAHVPATLHITELDPQW
ncbi:MAG: hypothetical protein ACJAYU_005185 [Bradymonadia bacterium]|jgi:hypothetical protein